MPGGTMLEIVDDSDAVIGVRSREEIHTLGLRHREVTSGWSRLTMTSSFSVGAPPRTRFRASSTLPSAGMWRWGRATSKLR